jgi:apolipoprotein N-acyltransferase
VGGERLTTLHGVAASRCQFVILSPVLKIHKSAWLLVLLSAGLQIVIFPLPGVYLLSWVAVAPLIVALLRARRPETLQLNESPKLLPATPAQGFLLGYKCGILWYAGTCYWIYATMRHYGGLSTPMALLALLLFCLYLGLYHGAFGLLLSLIAGEETPSRRALVAVPFLWVAVELARTRITGFPWNLLGISQVDNIPLARVAGATGVYGMAFEIMLVNTAFAAAFLVPRGKRKALLLVALGAAVVLQAGRLVTLPVLAPDKTALLVQANVPILEGADWTKDYFETTLRSLSDLSVGSGGTPPAHQFDLIVWPESPAPFYTGDAMFRDAISNVARQNQSWVIAGSIGVRNAMEAPGQRTQVFNSAALVGPTGDWAGRYDKVHLVPFGEFVPFPKLFGFASGLTNAVGDFGRGTSREPLEAGGTKVGVFICYESIFPDEVRQFVANGAQVLANISNDGWYGDSGAYAQHLNQTRMRAIENNRWLLSDTNTGVTASIDPYGRIVTRADRKVRTVLEAPYALTSVTTFYTRYGDWFAFLCAIISTGALVLRFTSRRKTER